MSRENRHSFVDKECLSWRCLRKSTVKYSLSVLIAIYCNLFSGDKAGEKKDHKIIPGPEDVIQA